MKQQIREATAFGVQPRILIHDNDGIYGQFGKDAGRTLAIAHTLIIG